MRFDYPINLRIPHIGFLWDKLRSTYPIIQHAAPIASAKGEILIEGATGIPLPRVWFINESDDQLVQFQVDRFYFNWRRRQDDYPRYEHVIDSFKEVRYIIEDMFKEHDLGELIPIEYELSYINHIPQGEGWNTIDDLPRIFWHFNWKKPKGGFLPNPVKVLWMTEFPLPDNKGRLNVHLKQAIRTEDKVPLLVLELKASGIDNLESKEAIHEWFDMAHEWIVRGFTDITKPRMHRLWGLEKNV